MMAHFPGESLSLFFKALASILSSPPATILHFTTFTTHPTAQSAQTALLVFLPALGNKLSLYDNFSMHASPLQTC